MPRKKKDKTSRNTVLFMIFMFIIIVAAAAGMFYASKRSEKDVLDKDPAGGVKEINLIDESIEAQRVLDNILLKRSNWQLIKKEHEEDEVEVTGSANKVKISRRQLAIGIPASTDLAGAGIWVAEQAKAAGLAIIAAEDSEYKNWNSFMVETGIFMKAGKGKRSFTTDTIYFFHNTNLKEPDNDIDSEMKAEDKGKCVEALVKETKEQAKAAGVDVKKEQDKDKGKDQVKDTKKDQKDQKKGARDKKDAKKEAKVPPAAKESGGRLAVIIDDCGYDTASVSSLTSLGFHFSYAILPFRKYSSACLDIVKSTGNVAMLHLPMEPMNMSAMSEGENTILAGMDKGKITELTRKAVNSLPGIRGVNNHQGSKVTSNEEAIKAVLQELKRDGMFFLDSRTSSNSLGVSVAQKLGVKTARNDLFLDNSTEVSSIRAQILTAINLAQKNGTAIAICHARPNTVKIWQTYADEFCATGVKFVYVTELLY